MKNILATLFILSIFLSNTFLIAQSPKAASTDIPQVHAKLPGPAPAGTGIFSKVLNSPVVSTPGDSRSVNWVDIDQDMDLDLFISNGPQGGANNYLYLNDGTGGFTAVSGQAIVQDAAPSDGATWADYDNDGDMDCFVVNWYGANNLFYKNNGDGTFEQVLTGTFVTEGGYSETASWGDYDRDGFLDLYVTNSSGNKRNFLYHNNGDGSLTKVSSGASTTDVGSSRSVNWTDYDLDGDLDLFVSNENNEHEHLYKNEAGVLSKITGGPLLINAGSTISSSWGDYDNDGDLDVFLANDQGNDALFRNNNGVFEKITDSPVVTSGGNSFGSQWADVDNDGDLDLFVTHAFWGGLWKNALYLNQGDGSFILDETEVVSTDQGWSYGCAFGDFDRDGDLDLAVANCYNASQADFLYKNHSSENGNNWVMINCLGTLSNRNAIGAKLWLHSQLNGQPLVQLREISAQSGYCGQNQLTAHFGLGATSSIDSLTVQWPNGLKETFQNLGINQYLTIKENQGVIKATDPQLLELSLAIQPNPSTDSVRIIWQMPSTGEVLLELFDLQGKNLYSKKESWVQGAQVWLLETLDIPAGNYVLRLQGEDWSSSTLLIRG